MGTTSPKTFGDIALEVLKSNPPRIGDIDIVFCGSGSRASEAAILANILARARIEDAGSPFFSGVSLLVPPGAAYEHFAAASVSEQDSSIAPVELIALQAASWPLVLATLVGVNAGTAIVMVCSELPRSSHLPEPAHTPTGAQTPFGEVWRVGALEDEWVDHLVDFAEQAKAIAREKQIYLLLHVGQPHPSSERHRQRLYAVCDSLAHIATNRTASGVPADALADWVQRVRTGEVDAVLAEIDARSSGRLDAGIIQVQVLSACGLDAIAFRIAETLVDDLEAFGDAGADTVLARVMLDNGYADRCRQWLATALSRPYLVETSLRTLHSLALRLEDEALQQSVEGVLFERYPNSRFSIARQAYRLMKDGDYASAARVTAISHYADLVEYLHRICTLLDATPVSLASVVEQVEQVLPAFRPHAILDCFAYALRAEAFVVAADFLPTLIDDDDALRRCAGDASLLLRLVLRQRDSAGEVDDDYFDAALQCVEFLTAHLALDPASSIRASLASSLSPEGSGYLGLLVLVRAVLTFPTKGSRIEEQRYPVAAPADEFAEFLRKYVQQSAMHGGARVLVGQALDSSIVTLARAPSLLVTALRQIEFLAEHLTDADGERVFDLVLIAALDLAATCGDEQAAGLALSMGATVLAAIGLSQRARNLTEHGLLLSKHQSSERRHRAWLTFADVYCRCNNPIEAAIGWMAASWIEPEQLSVDDAFYRATVLVRLLRDMHEPTAAREAIEAARHPKGLSAVQKLRLDHLEGTVLLVEANQSNGASAMTAAIELVELIRERLMPALNEGDSPVVLLVDEALRMCRRLGAVSGVEIASIEAAFHASPVWSMVGMLARDDASADMNLEQLLQAAARATSADDRARDAYHLTLFARRRLRRLAFEAKNLGDALFVLECCLSHSVVPIGLKRPGTDPIREQVLRQRLERHVKNPGRDPVEFLPPPPVLGALVEEAGVLAEVERTIGRVAKGGVDIEYVLLDQEQTLVRARIYAGELTLMELDASITASRIHEWLLAFPHGLEKLRGSGAINQFEAALGPLTKAGTPSERLTIFVCDHLIAGIPHHLLKLDPHTFKVRAPCSVVPSLSWLGSSMRAPTLGTGRVCAWVLPEDQDATISPLTIVKEELEGIATSTDLALVTGSTLLEHQEPLDLVVVVAHGGLGVAQRFFVTAGGEDGTQHTSWGFGANLAGSRVVVLLVCSGGRVDADPFSSRVVGLHVELLGRGVRTVVASPWKIQSTSAAKWVRHFLAAWHAGDIVARCVFEANEAIATAGEPADYLAMHVYGDPFQAAAVGEHSLDGALPMNSSSGVPNG